MMTPTKSLREKRRLWELSTVYGNSLTLSNGLTTTAEYRVFRLQHTLSTETADVIKKVVPHANVVADPVTNIVHVQADPTLATEIQHLLQKLDGSNEPKK